LPEKTLLAPSITALKNHRVAHGASTPTVLVRPVGSAAAAGDAT